MRFHHNYAHFDISGLFGWALLFSTKKKTQKINDPRFSSTRKHFDDGDAVQMPYAAYT